MLDLALGLPERTAGSYFLEAPDVREDDVRAQFARPAFSGVAELDLRFLPYAGLRQHPAQMERFGSGLKAVLAVAKPLHPV